MKDEYYWTFGLSLFVIGLINNTGYVMVGTASSELATSFKKE